MTPTQTTELCPVCNSPLKELEVTPSGKKLQRCSRGVWDSQTRKTEGCQYVKWINEAPQPLDEVCPKCGNPLVLQTTRTGKKMKKCSTAGWDREQRVATGCEYIEWQNGTTELLDEVCPQCGEKLVLATTPNGKKMKKCSTAGWDREFRQPTGCTYVEWLKSD